MEKKENQPLSPSAVHRAFLEVMTDRENPLKMKKVRIKDLGRRSA